MSVLVVGISHKSAPVELLGKLALDADGATKLIHDVMGGEHVSEATAIVTWPLAGSDSMTMAWCQTR